MSFAFRPGEMSLVCVANFQQDDLMKMFTIQSKKIIVELLKYPSSYQEMLTEDLKIKFLSTKDFFPHRR